MTIPVYQSGIQATLFKRIERRRQVAGRVGGASRQLDLTPFLGDGCSVQIAKNIREPAGSFSITLTDEADRTSGGFLDSLAGFVEPMDYVEMRIARQLERYAGSDVPIIMRGFVSRVQRSEAMSGGRPTRRVVISGQDYGKIPQMVQVIQKRDLANLNFTAWLSAFPLYVKFGYGDVVMSADEWMDITVSGVLNNALDRMGSFSGFTIPGPVPLINFEPGNVPGAVGGFGIQPYEGTMHSFIEQHMDAMFNEAFIEDRPDGPYMVYRPIPWTAAVDPDPTISIQGTPVPRCVDFDGAPLTLDARDVLSLSAGRGDANVVNIVLMEAPRAELAATGPIADQALIDGKNFITGNPNCAPELYGDRVLMGRSDHVSPSITGNFTRKEAGPAEQDKVHNVSWLTDRREVLKRLHADNVVFEEGSIVCKGNERIRAGNYLNFSRGNLKWTAYVTGVTHTFLPFQSYTTSIQYERGTGFLERTRASTSVYPSEVGQGPYDP